MADLNRFTNDIHLENDYGREPIALARFIETPAELAIGYGVAGFIGFVVAGFPALAYVGFVAGNDLAWSKSHNKSKVQHWKESQTSELLRLLEQDEEEESSSASENPSLETAKPIATNTQNCLETILRTPYVSRAFFGFQRTGKTYLAAIASKEIGCAVFHLNLLSVGTEDAQYWTHAHKSICCDLLTCSEEEAHQSIKTAIAIVEEFIRHPGNALLIVDEITFIGFKSNRYSEQLAPLLNLIADQIAAFSSAGMKRGKALWTIAPEFVAATLTDQVKAVKKLPLCYVTIEKGRTIGWKGNEIGFSDECFKQVATNFTITEPTVSFNRDRVAFISGCWMPLGDLPPLPPTAPTPETPSQLLSQWQAANPVEVFARASMAAFVPGVDETIVQPTGEAIDFSDWFPDDGKMLTFIDWLSVRKESNDSVSFEQIKGSYWAKKHGRDKATLDRILNQAIEYGFLIQTIDDTYTIGTW